jgi:hypothetical protein
MENVKFMDYYGLTVEEFNIHMPVGEGYFLQRRILIQKRNNLQEPQNRNLVDGSLHICLWTRKLILHVHFTGC